MDIKEGDYLTVGSIDYPIRAVYDWSKTGLRSAPFLALATVACSTKRSPAISSGKRGDPAAKLTGLYCTPLDPVNAEIQNRVALGTPMELLQTFVTDTAGYVQLVLEELKR